MCEPTPRSGSFGPAAAAGHPSGAAAELDSPRWRPLLVRLNQGIIVLLALAILPSATWSATLVQPRPDRHGQPHNCRVVKIGPGDPHGGPTVLLCRGHSGSRIRLG
jgi:hypothetical protein